MRKVLCFLLALLGLTSCRDTTPKGPPLALPTPASDGAYHFDTNSLYDLYRQNGREADRLLRGKTVVITGWVVQQYTSVEPDKEKLKKGERTPPDLYLHVDHKSNGFWLSSNGIICNFPESARDSLRKLIKRLEYQEQVQVRGKVDGKLGSVFLKDCTLEKAPH
ncbi:MAG: hypothetical protein QM758_09670 [Armatimonas sp.]